MGRVYGGMDENWAPIPCGIGAQSVVIRGQAPVFGRPGFTGGGSGLTGVGVTTTVGVGVTVGLGLGVGVGVGLGVGVGASHTG